MNYNGLGSNGVLPSVASNVRILLVTATMMYLSSIFEKYFYKVTTTGSTDDALSLLQARKNYYNIVIADLCMPEIKVYELVHKLHRQHRNIAVLLMYDDLTMATAREALDYGDCYVLPKPLSQYHISTLWHHILRVTGEVPTSLTDTSNASSCDGGESNQKWRNSERKLIKTEIESNKRTKNQITENSNSSYGIKVEDGCNSKKSRISNSLYGIEEDGCNSKKSRMTWTSSLHKKFLQAINILGEQRAGPETILRMMNEPCLTLHHISRHLQEYRDQTGRSVHLQNSAGQVMPTVQPAAPMRQISGGAPSLPKPPNLGKTFVGYTLDYVKKKMEARNRK